MDKLMTRKTSRMKFPIKSWQFQPKARKKSNLASSKSKDNPLDRISFII